MTYSNDGQQQHLIKVPSSRTDKDVHCSQMREEFEELRNFVLKQNERAELKREEELEELKKHLQTQVEKTKNAEGEMAELKKLVLKQNEKITTLQEQAQNRVSDRVSCMYIWFCLSNFVHY